MNFILPLISAPAGFPSPADDWVEESIDMNVYLGYGKSSTYLVRVEGNSMAGAGIHHGSTLVVDRSLPPRQDSIVLAIVDDDFTIRYWRRRQGGLFLEAARKGCPPIDMQQHRVEIWGVVTHSILKY